MNMQCDEIQSLFDPLLDHHLKRGEKSKIKNHLSECEHCRQVLQMEKEIRRSLSHLPELQCSEELVRRIQSKTWGIQEKEPLTEKIRLFFQFRYWKIVPVGVAIVVVAFLLFRNQEIYKDQVDSVSYTQEEIRQAREQARWTLAYVDNKIDESEKKAVEDVFIDRLPKIVRDCIRNAVPIFKGGQQ
ncbi:zf-HC2 domain-containing protein [bacterium]|nr:zf-HC2 domain-containing protein [bacterium]